MSTVAPKSSTAKRRATPSPEAASDAARRRAVADLEAEERGADVRRSSSALPPHTEANYGPLAATVRSFPGGVEALLAAFTGETEPKDWVDGALTSLAEDLAIVQDALKLSADNDAVNVLFQLENRIRAVGVVAAALRTEVAHG